MSDINPLWPVQGAAATTQQIRDNFRAAKSELEAREELPEIRGNELHWPSNLRTYTSGGFNFSGNEIYVSGGARFSSQEVYVSGGINIQGPFSLSGGAHSIYQQWDDFTGNAAFCGSLFNIYSYKYGPSSQYRYSQMYLNANEIYCGGGSFYVSTWMSISGGLGITNYCSISGDSLSVTAQFALSGNNPHNIYSQAWGDYGGAAFCGSTFNMYTYRSYYAPNYYYHTQLYISADDTYISRNLYVSAWTSLSGGLGITNDCTISGNSLRIYCYNEHTMDVTLNWGGPGVGYAIYVHDGDCWKPGGGLWAGTSDARTKADVRAYEAGLKELMQLDAQSFRYNGRGRVQETGKRFVSIPAEQAQEVMPEMVEKVRAKLEYDDEEETDILQVNATPLIYASLNAIKEIAKTLERIDQRLTALEAKDK